MDPSQCAVGTEELGVDLTPPLAYPNGRGYVVFPEDGSDPIPLSYGQDARDGASIESFCEKRCTPMSRGVRPSRLRTRALARKIEAQTVTFEEQPNGNPVSELRSVRARRILCATGTQCRLTAREQAVLLTDATLAPTHRTAVVTLPDVTLPYEGFAHLFIGGPARHGVPRRKSSVRLCLDVPLSLPVPRRGGEMLRPRRSDRPYRRSWPTPWTPPPSGAPSRGTTTDCARRENLVLPGVALAGGAAGSAPETTGAGLTLAIGDAIGFARLSSKQYVRDRRRAGRTSETVAIGLTVLFRDDAPEATAIRRAVYSTWRRNPAERRRAMAYAAGELTGTVRSDVRACGCCSPARQGWPRRARGRGTPPTRAGWAATWRRGWVG